MERNQALQYIILASEHAGSDFVLWLRYLSKWVDRSGHIFSSSDIAQIANEKKISPFQKTILLEAITPGTPTNEYIIKLREPRDKAEILAIERRLRNGEQFYQA